MCEKIENNGVSRRSVIKTLGVGLVTAPALVLPTPAEAVLFGFGKKSKQKPAAISTNRERTLSMINKNTGESHTETYWKNGHYIPNALARFDYLLRDHRQNSVRPIDTELLDLAHDMHMIFDQKQIHVVSCYRTKRTNDMLRRRSGKKVAKNSYHVKGMAMDLRIPGIPTKAIRNAAKTMSVGGVGWYARQGFVHMDTGPIRYWSG